MILEYLQAMGGGGIVGSGGIASFLRWISEGFSYRLENFEPENGHEDAMFMSWK